MHILVCDDDAAFAAQMDEYISEWFRAREIQVQSTVCTSGEQIVNVDIDEGLAMTKTLDPEEFEVMTAMTGR